MYTNLYVKTNYSLLSSLITIDNYIEYAKNHNLSSIAITDNNMFASMEFYKKCKNNNIKPIIGLEIELENGALLLYAKDYTGYQTLIKLSEIGSERRVELSDLEKFHDKVIGIIPFENKDTFNSVSTIISDLYLGYSNKKEEKESLNITNNIVYLKKNLYIYEQDKEYLKYLYMIRDGKTIADDTNYIIDNYFLDIKDIYDYTSNEHLFNTNKISDMCNLEIPSNKMLLPVYPDSNNLSSFLYLKKLASLGLNKRLDGKVSEVYIKRLELELNVIEKMNFSDYFLVVYDFIKYAKKNNILVGPGRGSAVGSLVCYCLGITEIDPLKYDLLFERFLNPERVSMPDIDTDFPDIYRNQVIEYVKEKYGKDKVSGIIAFDTLASKQAIRDVGRVLNIPIYQIDLLTKKIINSKTKLKDIYENNKDFSDLINSDSKLKLLYKIAQVIEGYPRNTTIHAAGIVISSVELDSIVPIIISNENRIIAYDKDYLEELGLIKMDFLGITALTTIMNIIEDIKKYEKINIDFNKIDLDDKKTLELFSKAYTTGIFQFESEGMKRFLQKLKPNRIEDIFAAIALYRPGANKHIDSYIRRKEKIEKVTYLDPSLEEILGNTYGIITYQEDVIKIAVKLAGYSLGEADILRGAMSKKKKEILIKERERFITRSVENGYKEEIASKIYESILDFAGYGFNKSHAIAYSIVAYKMAYLKCHYPKYFYSNLLTVDTNKASTYIREAKALGIDILKPEINTSNSYYVVNDKGIVFPFTGIKGIRKITSDNIVNARSNGYTDIYDFLFKNNNIDKKELEILIKAGVFDSFGINRKTLIDNVDELINYKELVKDLNEDYVLKPDLKEEDEYSKEELISIEKELFGFFLSNHPVTTYKAKYNNIISLDNISNYFNKIIDCIVLVEKVKVINTKKGDNMIFLDGSDEIKMCDFTIFPKLYKDYSNIKVGDIVKIKGRVERRYDAYQIIVNRIDKLN